jgi:AcrR family transcriptional regulator
MDMRWIPNTNKTSRSDYRACDVSSIEILRDQRYTVVMVVMPVRTAPHHGDIAAPPAASARRAPVQGRSQETVQRVLAATSALLGRGVAVEALTTAHIAADAGLSVGALYRFFPDKQAIVDAIALRHMELFQEQLAGQMMLAFPPDAPQFLSAVIDAFAAYLVANPDFRTVAYGAPGGGRYVSRPTHEAYAGSGEMSELVRSLLRDAFGIEMTETLEFRLRIAVEIGDRLLAFAFEQPDQEARERVLAEAKRVLGFTVFAP